MGNIKTAAGGRHVGRDTRPGDMADNTNFTWKDTVPYLSALGVGGLSYALARGAVGIDDKDKKKSIWDRIYENLIPLAIAGAGAYGGYHLGEGMLEKPAAAEVGVPDKITDARGRDYLITDPGLDKSTSPVIDDYAGYTGNDEFHNWLNDYIDNSNLAKWVGRAGAATTAVASAAPTLVGAKNAWNESWKPKLLRSDKLGNRWWGLGDRYYDWRLRSATDAEARATANADKVKALLDAIKGGKGGGGGKGGDKTAKKLTSAYNAAQVKKVRAEANRKALQGLRGLSQADIRNLKTSTGTRNKLTFGGAGLLGVALPTYLFARHEANDAQRAETVKDIYNNADKYVEKGQIKPDGVFQNIW